MKSTIYFRGAQYEIDLASPIDISIPLRFNGPQPNAFGVDPAISRPCEAGELVGDTRRGGSCNFEQYTFIPHCNGTHTECVGHITHERIAVRDCLKDIFVPALLGSVEPERAGDTDEDYVVRLDADDRLITRKILRAIVSNDGPQPSATAGAAEQALIIRTLPNDDSKLQRQYDRDVPPFFSTEAIEYVVECGIKHLLVDMPSIDRIFDEGKLSNHRVFWNLQEGSFEAHTATRIYNTITELIYVPDEVTDGGYLLNLQIAPFMSDASPSRPLLFKIN